MMHNATLSRPAAVKSRNTLRSNTKPGSTATQDYSDMESLFDQAAAIDPTMRIPARSKAKLAALKIAPTPYSKSAWLANMASDKISLFNNYPMPVRKDSKLSKLSKSAPAADFLGRLMQWRPARSFLVQTGPSRCKKYLKFPEVMRRWAGGKAVVSATDIHVRKTAIEKMLDIDTLTHINLLPSSKSTAQSLEMMSLVISTAGNLTDSHSDDVDGSNYCFCGFKLWLAWDTHEGLAKGLEDCDRSLIDEKAEFDMKTFLSLKSAMWFTVSDGQMLFLPGNYAHKVVTFENYIGVGGFYVSLPNIMSTMTRWETKWANWELDNTHLEADAIREELIEKVQKLHKQESKATLNKLGLQYALDNVKAWKNEYANVPNSDLPYCYRMIDALEGK